MRYYMDCEFIENGKTIDLISIGIVAADGRELYLQSAEFDPQHASDWVKEHVFPHLVLCPHIHVRGEPSVYVDLLAHDQKGQCTFERPAKGISGLSGIKPSDAMLIGAHADCPWRTREQIKREILHFMDISQYGFPELWGYFSAYDHVAFCQIFGKMLDLPHGFPMYTRDLKQWADQLGNPHLPDAGKGEHHALADAKWNQRVYVFLEEYERALQEHLR